MTRGTTPTLVLKTSFDLSSVALTQIWITLQNKDKSYDRTFDINSVTIDAENGKLEVSLTQEDTLEMPNEDLYLQVRMLDAYDKAYASKIKTVNVHKILKDGVIE